MEQDQISPSIENPLLNNIEISHQENILNNEKKILVLNKRQRFILFIVLFISNVIINIDHGAIPAAIEEIKQTFNSNDTEIGAIGALVYIGVAVGALFLTYYMTKINIRILLISSLVANSILIFLFPIFNNLIALSFNRLLTGVFQSMISIYIPVWIEQYGVKKWKTAKMTFFHLSSIGGLIFGYILTMEIKNYIEWKYTFYIESGVCVLFSIPYFFFESDVFSQKLIRIEKEENVENVEKDCNAENKITNKNENLLVDNKDTFNDENIVSSFGIRKSSLSLSKKSSLFYIDNPIQTSTTNSYINDIFSLIKEPVYMLSCLSSTSLIFISTGITFWTSDYMKQVLHESDDMIKFYFIIVSLSSPILGILFGGLIITNLFNGYDGKHSILFVIFMLLLGSGLVPVIYFQSTIFSFSAVLWALLFFGSSTIPTLQGISIGSIPIQLKHSANSLYNLILFLFGFSPGPFLYGFINDRIKTNHPKLAYMIMISFCGFASFFSIICGIVRYKKYDYYSRINEINIMKTEERSKMNDIL